MALEASLPNTCGAFISPNRNGYTNEVGALRTRMSLKWE
jgi:hypothetical protein